jgi:thymidylate synthase (FAD)
MKFIEDDVKFIQQEPGIDGMFRMMEKAARICYKTEDLTTDDSAHRLIEKTIIPSGHTSVLEFGTVYLKYNILNIFGYFKYILDRYSRVKFRGVNVYVTTTYRTIMQGGYKDPVKSIENKFNKNWKGDLKYWCEPTKYHHKRYCFKFIMDRVGSQSVVRHRGVWGISYAQESTRFVNYNRDKFDKNIMFSLPSKFYELIDKFNMENFNTMKINTNKRWVLFDEDDVIDWNDEKLSDGMNWSIDKKLSFDMNDWSIDEKLSFLRKFSEDWNVYEKALKQAEESYMMLSEDYGWKPQDARGVLNLDIKTEFMMCAYKEDWRMWLFRRLDKHAHPHIIRIAKMVKNILDKKLKNKICG